MLNGPFSEWPKYTKEEVEAVSKVLYSNKVNYWTGNECKLFEEEFGAYIGCKYAIAIANGTLALDLALKCLGITTGDEVLVTSRTFMASVSSIVNAGAIPVFVDVDPASQNINAKYLKSAITKNTKAILCVHLAGWPCEMDKILSIARKYDLRVIEDCAQAHGATYKGKKVGSLGDVGCWSFCQDKIISTGGEGGMVTTNNKTLWKKMWAYKDHGKDWDLVSKNVPSNKFAWLHSSFGSNFRMTEIQAVIGRIQLRRLPEWQNQRINNANKIWEAARQTSKLYAPHFSCEGCDGHCDKNTGCNHAAYKCYVFVKNGQDLRDRFLSQIKEKGIPCSSGSCSEVYLEKAFDQTNLRPKSRLANARKLAETSIMFFCHPSLTAKEISKTCKVIRDVCR